MIAKDHGIATTSLFNLVDCESKWDPLADNVYDRGLVQINRTAWPDITDAQAFDPEFSLNFAAEKISKGQGYLWTCGNCYSFAKVLLGKLPKMADILPNTPYPVVGGLTIFDYNGKKHVAVNKKITQDGILVRECNYEENLCKERMVKQDDPRISGQWRKDP